MSSGRSGRGTPHLAGRGAHPFDAIPTMGWLSGWPPSEPKNGAVPKLKIPPSEATIR